MIDTFFTGYVTGLGLIVAIGPQNSFLIKQGIKKEYHLLIALICSLSDALLITLGVLGIGSLVEKSPYLIKYTSLMGSVLLSLYGVKHVISVFKNSVTESDVLEVRSGLIDTIIIVLGLTFLNPHVYLDTLLLLGSISMSFKGNGNYLFGIGAILASFTWFFLLAFGSEKLSPLFKKRVAWRTLDSIIAFIMFYMGSKLFIMFLELK
ncbi:MAG: amino acid transporter [Spirochaetales bacterium]|nr:amino acid transporter [Spirochaetales bacterium]